MMIYSTVTIASVSLEKPEFKCLALGYPADRPMNLRFLGHQSLTTILPIASFRNMLQEETLTITVSTSVNCSKLKAAAQSVHD